MDTRKLVDYAMDGEAAAFREELYGQIHDRISAAIEAKKQEIAQNLIAQEEYVAEEEEEEHDDEKEDKQLVKKMVKKSALKEEELDEEESGLRMAAHAAHKDGKKSFEFKGKTYPVQVREEEEEIYEEGILSTLAGKIDRAKDAHRMRQFNKTMSTAQADYKKNAEKWGRSLEKKMSPDQKARSWGSVFHKEEEKISSGPMKEKEEKFKRKEKI